jgi:hypothetical protein
MELHWILPCVIIHAVSSSYLFLRTRQLTTTSETKGKTLEELDQVFSVPTHVHAAYGLRQIPYFFGRYILRRDLKPERLYERETEEDRRASEAGVV